MLAAREDSGQTGLVHMTTIHHMTYNKISDTIQQKLYGPAYDTLQHCPPGPPKYCVECEEQADKKQQRTVTTATQRQL